MNLLFIELAPEKLANTPPFIVAYHLDFPGLNKWQWRVDVRGVEAGICNATSGMLGVWGYLQAGTWLQLTADEAYARFPALQEAIENWSEPW